ncbi:MAG TPA: alpha/beta fold hydrolase [Burkholderiales bacterium]|nr:alpha/beta fold hydrolase [Burkholderiales bacterium]
MAEPVVLVHGLWMNALAMLPLANRIQRAGFDVTRFGYRSVKRGLSENARALAERCRHVGAEINLVGHSLGGLVILSMLNQHADIKAKRVVLLGSPYADIASARGFARFAGAGGMMGLSIADWMGGARPGVPQGVELGVVAGDISFGLGRFLVALPPPNDGVVMLDETKVPGASDSIVVHVSHSGMLVSPEVGRAVCAFLRKGSFQ